MMSLVIRTGRRRQRSIHAPAGSPMTAKPSVPAALMTPNWKGDACSTNTASRGIATPLT